MCALAHFVNSSAPPALHMAQNHLPFQDEPGTLEFDTPHSDTLGEHWDQTLGEARKFCIKVEPSFQEILAKAPTQFIINIKPTPARHLHITSPPETRPAQPQDTFPTYWTAPGPIMAPKPIRPNLPIAFLPELYYDRQPRTLFPKTLPLHVTFSSEACQTGRPRLRPSHWRAPSPFPVRKVQSVYPAKAKNKTAKKQGGLMRAMRRRGEKVVSRWRRMKGRLVALE